MSAYEYDTAIAAPVEVPIHHAECEHGVMLSERTHGTLDCPLHPLGRATITLVPEEPERYLEAW